MPAPVSSSSDGRDELAVDPQADLYVFTAEEHLARGYCCGCGYRNCPYGLTISEPSDGGWRRVAARFVRSLGLANLYGPTIDWKRFSTSEMPDDDESRPSHE